MTFDANFIFSEADHRLIRAGLADDQYDTKNYVVFQKTPSASEQDRRLGLDGPHFEINEQSLSGYEVITFVHLFDNRLVVGLKEGFSASFTEVCVNLRTLEGITEFAETLRLIFGTQFEDHRSTVG